ncbi:MAG: hypothetical protein U1E64_14600 [Sphingomonadaceae bacterium]
MQIKPKIPFTATVEGFHTLRAIAHCHKISTENADRWAAAICEKFSKWKLSPSTRDVLDALCTGMSREGFYPSSNFHIRRASSSVMLDVFMRFARERGYPDFHYVTFCWKDGFTYLSDPSLNLKLMYGQVFRSLNDLGIESVFFFELSPFRKLPGGPGGFVHLHVHAICWTEDIPFPVEEVEALRRTRKFVNFIDAPSVVVTHEEREAPRKTPNSTDIRNIAGLAGYSTKMDMRTKRLKPKADHSQGFVMEKPEESSGNTLTRLLEIQSHIPILKTVHSTGEGKHVKLAWKRELTAQLRAMHRAGRPLSPRYIEEAWIDARKENGPRHYRPCEIIS